MDRVRVSIKEAFDICFQALTNSGTEEIAARDTAHALVRAEVDGQAGHGLSRIPSYAAQVQSGKVKGDARICLEGVRDGLFRINADHGFAYPAIRLAVGELALRAEKLGIAAAAIYHSHHFGVAGHPCEELARQGLVCFVYGNTPKAIAPFGAKEKILGTNPIAFAAPMTPDPLVIDFALSVVARGKIMAAQQTGSKIEKGWALTARGEPTTDPDLALAGSMLPIGGAKGAALALMVEVMSACLVGAAFGTEAGSLFEGEGAPPDLGQVIIALDAKALSAGQFASRIRQLKEVYEELAGARLPGTRRLQNRAMAAENGLSIPESLYDRILRLGQE